MKSKILLAVIFNSAFSSLFAQVKMISAPLCENVMIFEDGFISEKSFLKESEKNQIVKQYETYTDDGGISTLYIKQNNDETVLNKSLVFDKKVTNVDEFLSINLYDINGKLITKSKIINKNFNQNNTKENLPFGAYLYMIINSQNEIIVSGKIIR